LGILWWVTRCMGVEAAAGSREEADALPRCWTE
jgi:hypothetical protein